MPDAGDARTVGAGRPRSAPPREHPRDDALPRRSRDDDALAQRHAEYLALWDSGEVRMFRVEVDGAAAGYAGWWAEEHDGAPVYEIGCVVEPAWQGRGVASAALGEVVRRALETGDPRPIVGYANVENVASNALCDRVGFTLDRHRRVPRRRR